jgi:prepilin-type N-terminal cleavage/methylation domain-containing protein
MLQSGFFTKGAKQNFRNSKGFSLIELMTVVVILSFLAAVAIPVFLGMRYRTKLQVFISDARSAAPEIQAWAQVTNSSRPYLREADTNCDGIINSSDMTNNELLIAGVAQTYATCRNIGLSERSPFENGLPLWSTDPTIPDGQITLIQDPSKITVIAKSIKGEIVFNDYIHY